MPVYHSYEQGIIILFALSLKVSFSSTSHSEFLVLTHNILGMIVSEKKIGTEM
jgi:hypothetical protein